MSDARLQSQHLRLLGWVLLAMMATVTLAVSLRMDFAQSAVIWLLIVLGATLGLACLLVPWARFHSVAPFWLILLPSVGVILLISLETGGFHSPFRACFGVPLVFAAWLYGAGYGLILTLVNAVALILQVELAPHGIADAEIVGLVSSVGLQGVMAYATGRIHADLLGVTKRLADSRRAALHVAEETSSLAILRALLREAIDLAGAAQGMIYTCEERGFVLRGYHGLLPHDIRDHNLEIIPRLGDGMMAAIRLGRPTIVLPEQVSDRARPLLAGYGIPALLGVPVLVGGEALALLVLGLKAEAHTKQRMERCTEDLNDLLPYVTIALQQARTLEETERALDEALDEMRQQNRVLMQETDVLRKGKQVVEQASLNMAQLMIRAVGGEHAGGMAHAERTAEYAVLICRQLGLAEDQTDRIRRAALLHDLDRVMAQEADGVECGESEQKTGDPRRLLRSFPLPPETIDIIAQRHERMDGKGHPQGLRGDEITLGARIVGLANALDCLVVPQDGSAALSLEEALQRVQHEAGTRWDPEIVATLVTALQQHDHLSA